MIQQAVVTFGAIWMRPPCYRCRVPINTIEELHRMRHATTCITALAFLVAAAGASAANAPAPQDESRLVGAWQEGLTPGLAQGTPQQRQMAKKAGLLGAVVAYKPDHRFEMYPPCGAKRDDLRKAGLQSIQGNWKLAESGELVSTIAVMGRELTTQARLQWKDDQLILLGKDGKVLQKAGKYEGPLPPEC
jgi:hypothetical protein